MISWLDTDGQTKPKEEFETKNMKFRIILDFDNNGYLFNKNNSKWIMSDVTVTNNRLWIETGQYPFLVGINQTNIHFTQDHKNYTFPVANWNNINGYIMVDSTVNLFINGHVIIFSDIDQIVKHATSYIYEIPYTKVTYKEFFNCDGQKHKFEFKGYDYQIMPSNSYRRTMTIIVLFLMHFIVATIMIILILLYFNPTTRPLIKRLYRENVHVRSNRNCLNQTTTVRESKLYESQPKGLHHSVTV